MQKIVFHGIASYTFEYKRSSETTWTTVGTTNTSEKSSNYTITGLTATTTYNIKVTVIDQAGNSNSSTDNATTDKPAKVRDGVLIDITSDGLHKIGEGGTIDISHAGERLDLVNIKTTLTIPSTFSGTTQQTVTMNTTTSWYEVARDPQAIYVFTPYGPRLKLSSFLGVNDGVGVLDNSADYLVEFENAEKKWARNLKLIDLVTLGDSYTFVTSTADVDSVPYYLKTASTKSTDPKSEPMNVQQGADIRIFNIME